YLACALGHQACTTGLKTLYLNMNRFVDVLKQSRLDGTFSQMLSRLDKNDLIVLDDFGLQKMDSDTRIALLTLLEERYEKKSMIIMSQLPLDKWYDYIAEATLADAIMDRLINSSHHINLEGPSLRKRKK
ncbi:MAG: ATP-binding protein, partial [Bacteroides sp.]